MGKDTYSPQHVIASAGRALADAVARCNAVDRAGEENIHEIRKAMKEVRAYWRLMQGALGKHRCGDGNLRCGQAAKQLSAARDQVIMLATLGKLSRGAGAKTAKALDQAKQAVREAVNREPPGGIDWAKTADLIREDAAAWSGLDPASIDPADIRRSWERTRRKMQACYRRCRKSADPESMHRWRKWSTQWLLQEQLLHPGRAKRISRLDKLGDLLGRHHDLAVLSQWLEHVDCLSEQANQRARRAIRKRQDELTRRVRKLGRGV